MNRSPKNTIKTQLLLLLLFVLSITACKFKPSGPCDKNISLNSSDPIDAAKAMGICDGLVDATWELPDGTTPTGNNFNLGHGILPDFSSPNPAREGDVLLVLSSGTARRPSDLGYQPPSSDGFDKGYSHGFPQTTKMTFPVARPSCPVPNSAHDGISLFINMVVPRGVIGYSFDFNYFTADYPNDVCTRFADSAAVIVTDSTLPNINILVDANGNPVTSQTADLLVCFPSTGYTCPLGSHGLEGTGFDDHGSTGWSTIDVPATPGDTITLKLMIWDSGDGFSDSVILFDNFRWLTP